MILFPLRFLHKNNGVILTWADLSDLLEALKTIKTDNQVINDFIFDGQHEYDERNTFCPVNEDYKDLPNIFK